LRDEDWRPTCSIETLVARSQTLASIRAFFAQRGVLEVDTPVLSRTTVTDPAIESLWLLDAGEQRYLQTSPEYQMKRLLAAGAPSMVRIGPVFRAEESGRLHNPEFTMIEWYRLGFDLAELMDEVAALVDRVLGMQRSRTVTYHQLLREGAGVDAFESSVTDLVAALARLGVELSPGAAADRRALLDLLVTQAIDALGAGRVFIVDYPADQAALARLVQDSDGRAVAARFELIIDGVEVANGYDELADADVMQQRMTADVELRRGAGRDAPAHDRRLLAAMRYGLPRCSGVALGFDRLMMRKLGVARIEEVMPFGIARA
jgi:elongation factor P--(R)-beta-lysine ligase